MTSSFVLTLAYIWAVLRAFFSALRAYADITFSALYPTIVVPYSDMRGKRCLVTGSNIGLGKEIALGLAGMGAEIHLVCRDRAKAVSAREEIIKRTGNKKVYLETIDVSSFASIRAFVQRWSSRSDSDRRIDVFISNAGVATSCKVTTVDGLELCYQVNTLSHVAVITQLLQRNCFASDARIIMTSSAGIYSSKVMHPEDVNSPDLLGGRVEGWKPWNPLAIFWLIWTLSARSKAQQVIFANELQKRLATIPRYQGITVSTFHPGLVQTSIYARPTSFASNPSLLKGATVAANHMGISAQQGATTGVYLASSPNVVAPELRGKYWERCQWRWTPIWMEDPAIRKALWTRWMSDTGLDAEFFDKAAS